MAEGIFSKAATKGLCSSLLFEDFDSLNYTLPSRLKFEERLTCSICHDQFTDPRSLSCTHVFCLRCLKRLPTRDSSISCPLCRKVHYITNLSTLPRSSVIDSTFEIYNLVKKIPDIDGDKRGASCDNCNKLPPSNAANICCLQCNMFLCHDCLQQHNNWKPYAAHKTLSIEEMIEAVGRLMPDKINQPVKVCNYHSKSLDVFCETCEEFVCQSCVTGWHIGHKFDDFCHELHLIDMKTLRLEHSLKMLKHRKNEIVGQAGLVREEIQYTVSEIRSALEKEEKKLLGQIDQTLIHKNAVLDHQIKEVESSLRELEKHRNGLAQLARLSTLHEFKATKSNLLGKLKEMSDTFDIKKCFEPLEEANFKLERNNEMRQILLKPIIGKVNCSSFVTTVRAELKRDIKDRAGVSKDCLDFTVDSNRHHILIPVSLIDCYAFSAEGHRYSISCVRNADYIHRFDITIPIQCKRSQIHVEICGIDTLRQHALLCWAINRTDIGKQ